MEDKKKDKKKIERTYRYKETPIVATCRPEFRSNDPFVNDVLERFADM